MDITVIDTPQLGDRSYIVHDGRFALVVDAMFDGPSGPASCWPRSPPWT